AESARLFAREGATVLLAARSEDRLAKVVDSIKSDGGTASQVVCDVTKAADIERLANTAVERYCQLDCAFNNAALSAGLAPLADLSEAELDELIATNIKGMWLAMRAEIRAMLAAGNGGSIVNMTSLAGIRGVAGMSTYAATKHAVIGLSRSAAHDYGRSGLRINAIAPGLVDTEAVLAWKQGAPEGTQAYEAMTPLGRTGRPIEVAEAAAWLLSDRAGYLTGAVLAIDGGMTA
ncbi:MAG: SDR family oxidoreductase, partial [Kutzneria sp.]|nr:SDR family oxidoreductase [Kutzneria sp.]